MFGVRKLFPPILKVDIFSEIIYPDDFFSSLILSVPSHHHSHPDLPPLCLSLENKEESKGQ